jgi:hypothetical protein
MSVIRAAKFFRHSEEFTCEIQLQVTGGTRKAGRSWWFDRDLPCSRVAMPLCHAAEVG